MATKKVISLDQLKLLAQRVKAEDTKLDAKITAIEVPENVSDLTNDAEYQSKTQVTQAINEAIGKIDHLAYKKVDSFEDIHPEEEGADKYIYLVPKDEAGDKDSYDEYMVIDGTAEKVGDWKVDLSNYVQKSGTDRLMKEAEGTKLAGISDGANKVAKGTSNGQIKIDGDDVDIYTLPADVLHETDIAVDGDVTTMLNEVFGEA